MSLICNISNTIAALPVVTPAGLVFDKKLLLSLLASNGGVCPVTKVPLSEDTLIAVVSKASSMPAVPASVTGTSVPGILATLQTEWDGK
jgi:hypothetical protein